MAEEFNPTRLDLARRRRGFTLWELGQVGGIGRNKAVRYCSGKETPTRDDLERFATALEFPVAFFFGPTLEEPPLEAISH